MKADMGGGSGGGATVSSLKKTKKMSKEGSNRVVELMEVLRQA